MLYPCDQRELIRQLGLLQMAAIATISTALANICYFSQHNSNLIILIMLDYISGRWASSYQIWIVFNIPLMVLNNNLSML